MTLNSLRTLKRQKQTGARQTNADLVLHLDWRFITLGMWQNPSSVCRNFKQFSIQLSKLSEPIMNRNHRGELIAVILIAAFYSPRLLLAEKDESQQRLPPSIIISLIPNIKKHRNYSGLVFTQKVSARQTQSSGSVTHCSTISRRLGFSMAAATRSLSLICLLTAWQKQSTSINYLSEPQALSWVDSISQWHRRLEAIGVQICSFKEYKNTQDISDISDLLLKLLFVDLHIGRCFCFTLTVFLSRMCSLSYVNFQLQTKKDR